MSSHITLVALILWRIWKCCNERLYNGHTIEPQIAVYMGVKDVTEYIRAMEERDGVNTYEVIVQIRSSTRLRTQGIWDISLQGVGSG